MHRTALLIALLALAACDPDSAGDAPRLDAPRLNAPRLAVPGAAQTPTADPDGAEWTAPRQHDFSTDVIKATPDA